MLIERMKTPSSRKWSARRMRSPSSAPLRERARRVDGDHAHPLALGRAGAPTSAGDQARLADSRRAGEADDRGLAGARVELAHELVGERVAVLDEGDRPRDRALVAARDARRPERAGRSAGGSPRLQRPRQGGGEDRVLLGRADRDPDACRGRRTAPAGARSPHRASSARARARAVADVDGEEVGARRERPHPRGRERGRRARPGRARSDPACGGARRGRPGSRAPRRARARRRRTASRTFIASRTTSAGATM